MLTASGRLLLDEGRKILGATAYLADRVKELATGWEPRLRLGLESTTEREPVFLALTAEGTTTGNQERHIAWKISNKGKAPKRLSLLLSKLPW